MSRREIGALKTAINVKFNLDFWFDERAEAAPSHHQQHMQQAFSMIPMSGKTKGMTHQHNFSHNHSFRRHTPVQLFHN